MVLAGIQGGPFRCMDRKRNAISSSTEMDMGTLRNGCNRTSLLNQSQSQHGLKRRIFGSD